MTVAARGDSEAALLEGRGELARGVVGLRGWSTAVEEMDHFRMSRAEETPAKNQQGDTRYRHFPDARDDDYGSFDGSL